MLENLTLESAIAILAVAIPILVFLRILARDWFNSKTGETTIENVEKDIEDLKNAIEKLSADLGSIQLKLADGTSDARLDAIKQQMIDMKDTISKLQDKLEKMTDLTIRILSKES